MSKANEKELRTGRRGRPRADRRTAETRLRLIRAGLEIVTEKGFLAAGISEVLERAEAPKGCFYHYFKDKEDFGLQLIDAYEEFFSTLLDRCFENPSLSPLERLKAFVALAREGMARHQYRRGCLVGNLGQEIGSLTPAVREKLKRVFYSWQSRLASCLSEAQGLGEISGFHEVEDLATFFWIGWEGAVLRAKLDLSPESLNTFAKVYLSLLGKK